MDDYKAKAGGYIRVLGRRKFAISLKAQGIFRVYHNDFVRISNIGSDMSVIMGCYKPQWFVCSEIGVDNAAFSYFAHSDMYKSQFPDVKDGWYEISMGQKLYFNLKTGFSLKKNDLTLSVCKINSPYYNSSLLLPFYLQIGFNRQFLEIQRKYKCLPIEQRLLEAAISYKWSYSLLAIWQKS